MYQALGLNPQQHIKWDMEVQVFDHSTISILKVILNRIVSLRVTLACVI